MFWRLGININANEVSVNGEKLILMLTRMRSF